MEPNLDRIVLTHSDPPVIETDQRLAPHPMTILKNSAESLLDSTVSRIVSA
jgi:hypothetical protein